jgi:hypothetical protein
VLVVTMLGLIGATLKRRPVEAKQTNVHLFDTSDATHDLPIGDSVSVAFDEAATTTMSGRSTPQTMRGKVIVSE